MSKQAVSTTRRGRPPVGVSPEAIFKEVESVEAIYSNFTVAREGVVAKANSAISRLQKAVDKANEIDG